MVAHSFQSAFSLTDLAIQVALVCSFTLWLLTFCRRFAREFLAPDSMLMQGGGVDSTTVIALRWAFFWIFLLLTLVLAFSLRFSLPSTNIAPDHVVAQTEANQNTFHLDWTTGLWLAIHMAVITGLYAFGIVRLHMLYRFWSSRNRDSETSHFTEFPTVTFQVPIFNEQEAVARVLDCVCMMDYPHDKLQIQVLDDSTDETAALVGQLCARYYALGLDISCHHRVHRRGFRSGALAEALCSAKGEFICVLDADYLPRPDYLQKIIHYFTDAKVGFVQPRLQFINEKFSLLTKLQAMFLKEQFEVRFPKGNEGREFLGFNNTATMWRATAIKDVGGWHQDALAEEADLAYRIQLRGWKRSDANEVVVPAELPSDMYSFKSQQFRRTKGGIQASKKLVRDIWSGDMSFLEKSETTMLLFSDLTYLLALCALLLVFSTSFLYGGSLERFALVDLPFLFFAVMPFGISHLLVHDGKRRRGRWKDLFYLPLLFAFRLGMCINNGRAVFEGMCTQRNNSVRTAQYVTVSESLRTSTKGRSSPNLMIALALEIVLMGALAWAIAFATERGQWTSIPLLLLVFVGFAIVAGGSLLARLKVDRFRKGYVA